MVVIVARIICQNFSSFEEGLGTVVPLHLEHRHSAELKEKSNLVNLGVLESTPSSVSGVIDIMENIQQYVPSRPDGSPYTLMCSGDGLSIERMVDAKRSRAGGRNLWDMLTGLEPCPQEFHKRLLIMQDTMDELFTGRSGSNRGTLFHVKNNFNRKNAKKSVKDAFNHDSDFLRFVTEGYVCLFAKKMLGMESLDDKSTLADLTERQKWNLLQAVSTDIVEDIWHQTSDESMLEVLTADIQQEGESAERRTEEVLFCWCQEETGEDMLECSNSTCSNGQWFHLSCVGIDEDGVPEGGWWCSDECRVTRVSIFCICKRSKQGLTMLRGDAKEKCPRGEWFHHACMKLDASSLQSPSWYCSTQCRHAGEDDREPPEQDHMYNYSCAVTWRGLNDMVRRDAVREGDGEAMLCHWRIDMLEYWNRNHFRYLIIGHRFLSGVSGWLQPRLAHDLTWNRTANLQGGEGRNIELDLVNEFLNNDFKENLKHARGRYNPVHVARTAQIVSSLGKQLDGVYEKQVASTYTYHITATRMPHLKADVKAFVQQYEGDMLVQKIAGREHRAFPRYVHNVEILNPTELNKRLKRYSTKLQNGKDIRPRQQTV